MKFVSKTEYLEHHGILGMKWGVRRYQNEDGTLTSAGRSRYGYGDGDGRSGGGNGSGNGGGNIGSREYRMTNKVTASRSNMKDNAPARTRSLSKSYVSEIDHTINNAIRKSDSEGAKKIFNTLEQDLRVTASVQKDKSNPYVKQALKLAKSTMKGMTRKELKDLGYDGTTLQGTSGTLREYTQELSDEEMEEWLLNSAVGLGVLQRADLMNQGYTAEEVDKIANGIEKLQSAQSSVRGAPYKYNENGVRVEPRRKLIKDNDSWTLSTMNYTYGKGAGSSTGKKIERRRNDNAIRNNQPKRNMRNLQMDGMDDGDYLTHWKCSRKD